MELKQDFRGLFLNMSMKISIFDFFNPLFQTRHVWSIYKIDTVYLLTLNPWNFNLR